MRRHLITAVSELKNGNYRDVALPAGAYNAHIDEGRLFAGRTDWKPLFLLRDDVGKLNRSFTLAASTTIRIQAQDATKLTKGIAFESTDTYALASGGASELLHRADRAILMPRRVTADEDQESSDGADRAHRQWFRGSDGRIDLHWHGGRAAAFASVGQYFVHLADDRHVFRDSHGHVVRRYLDGRECGDHRGWRGHNARDQWMVVGRHITSQGRARDHTGPGMVQRRGLAGHASFGRRLLRQEHGGILALTPSLGVVA